MDWSQVLSDLRQRGWTQQLLAVHCGVFQSSISALATGKTADPAFTLGHVLKQLHKSGKLPKAAESGRQSSAVADTQ